MKEKDLPIDLTKHKVYPDLLQSRFGGRKLSVCDDQIQLALQKELIELMLRVLFALLGHILDPRRLREAERLGQRQEAALCDLGNKQPERIQAFADL